MQKTFHHNKQHGFIRSVENVMLTNIIPSTDGTIGCVMSGKCVVMQMVKPSDKTRHMFWDVTDTVPPPANVCGSKRIMETHHIPARSCDGIWKPPQSNFGNGDDTFILLKAENS